MIYRRTSVWLVSVLAIVGCDMNRAPSDDETSTVRAALAGRAATVAPAAADDASARIRVAAQDPSLVTGTGENCQSYTPVAGGMCAGWYCGVDKATLTKAVDPAAKCGGDVDLLCRGTVVTAVARCARTVKSQNITASSAELRPLVRTCVYEDPEIKAKTPPECLDCTIDAASCASDHCLLQCLAGDNAQCDACRRSVGCDQQVFSCGGLPAPIE